MYNGNPSENGKPGIEAALEKIAEVREVNDISDAFRNLAFEKNPSSFNVLFGALANTSVSFMFEYLLAADGKLESSNIEQAKQRFSSTVDYFAAQHFEALKRKGLELESAG